MIRTVLLILLGSLHLAVMAQLGATRYFDTWRFNDSLLIAFDGVNPPVLDPMSQPTLSGNAQLSMCDPYTGELLFTVDFEKILDGQGNLLPSGLLPTSLCSAALPHPGNSDLYYIFTSNYDSLFYSVFDRTLNGGLGGIVPGQRLIPLWVVLSGVTAFTNTEGTRHTLIGHENGTDRFVMFHVTALNGLETTPISETAGPVIAGWCAPGWIKTSASSHRIAMIHPENEERISVYDLDRNTAQLTHAFTYHWRDSLASFEFAPEADLLYISDNNDSDGSLYQLDISTSDTALISASELRLDVGPNGQLGFRPILQLAPNGILYYYYDVPVVSPSLDHIQAILYPDVSGPGCTVDIDAMDMQQPWGIWRWWPWVFWPRYNFVSVPELSSVPQAKAYPMPMSDQGCLVIEQGIPDRVEWSDYLGRIARIQTAVRYQDGWSLDGQGLPSGSYTVRAVDDGTMLGVARVQVAGE
ncbi:MAG: hypothetical protein KDB88_08490 [Flavobacteriales bacterium]|nr:hypothetical protein [Flavobacteriales bacterium]